MNKSAMALLGLALVLSSCRDCGGCGGSGGGGRTEGAVVVNLCPFYKSVLVKPLTQSVGHLIDVETEVHDLDGDDVEVSVTSDCGEVVDPLQTGDSSTAVRCDEAKLCTITVRVSDDGFNPDGCSGTNDAASSTTPIDCQP